MKKIMVVFGTRPEAIKMCPLIIELMSRSCFDVVVCVTGQHHEMLDSVLDFFRIKPKYNLKIMKKNQTLSDITCNVIMGMEQILRNENPDIVLVHGDTSTTFAVALKCFYLRIPIGHVEAGLRTNNIVNPFPEEWNRRAVGILSNLHFAPTESAKENLLREGHNAKDIFVTGNTAIDALKYTVCEKYSHPILEWVGNDRLILITAHRRESIGEPMRNMFRAIRKALEKYPNIKALYPIHMNPVIREIANEELFGSERIRITDPLNVIDFHNIIKHSYLILSDSGGIQEEAPALKKPVLVMRDTTERPEGIKAGTLKLVGTDENYIYRELCTLLENEIIYNQMVNAKNPYGDGTASVKIADVLEMRLCLNE